MIDPYDDVALDKLQKSIDNASIRSNRSNRSQKYYQPPIYDPQVVNLHKRPPKIKIYMTKGRDSMGFDLNGDGCDGGDRGDQYILQAPIPLTLGAIG